MHLMPEKTPEFWASLWLALSNPLWQGAIMAFAISLLRIIWDAKETSVRRTLAESLICGGLSLSASTLIDWMGWPANLSIAAGGAIGFIGVSAVRELIIRFIGRKVDTL